MKNIVFTCAVLQYEAEAAIRESGLDCELEVLEAKLHNNPDILRNTVQERIDECKDADRVYLTYGNCGNGLLGVRATHCELVLPRTQDCIHTLLFYDPTREDRRRDSYFSSKGWKVWKDDSELNRMIKRYGEERGKRMYRTMYANYKNLVFMRTYVGEEEEAVEQTKDFADFLSLQYMEADASYRVLTDLFSGNWDERHLIVPKGGTICAEDFKVPQKA
mgnify:CR=1 FL=1